MNFKTTPIVEFSKSFRILRLAYEKNECLILSVKLKIVGTPKQIRTH